jgi:hypothetical protein
MRALLLALWLALLPWAAQAEPYLAVANGFKCSACHVNPTGGGLRNQAGALYAQNALAAWRLPEGAQWSGGIGSAVRLGGDLRTGETRTRVPGEATQKTSGMEQFRLYADVQLVSDLFGAYVDQQLRPGRSQRQEAYLRLGSATRGWYAKAGQFYLPFGWRLQDNSAFVRSLSGVSMATPDKGVELGLELGDWSLQLARSNGPGNVGPISGHQWTGQAVWLQPWGRAGLALASTKSSAGGREAVGLFGGFSTGPLAWLGEVDLVSDGGFAEGRRQLLATLAEVNWGVARGHNLKFSAEWLDPDRKIAQDHKARLSLLYEFTPIAYTQLRFGLRRYDGIPQAPVDNRRSWFVELHAFM